MTSIAEVNNRFGGPKERYYKEPYDPIRDMVASVLSFSRGNRIVKFEPNILNDSVTVTFDDGTKAVYNLDGQNVSSN